MTSIPFINVKVGTVGIDYSTQTNIVLNALISTGQTYLLSTPFNLITLDQNGNFVAFNDYYFDGIDTIMSMLSKLSINPNLTNYSFMGNSNYSFNTIVSNTSPYSPNNPYYYFLPTFGSAGNYNSFLLGTNSFPLNNRLVLEQYLTDFITLTQSETILSGIYLFIHLVCWLTNFSFFSHWIFLLLIISCNSICKRFVDFLIKIVIYYVVMLLIYFPQVEMKS